MKRFAIYRPNPPSDYIEKGHANAAEEVQCEGVVFSDGTVSVRWLTKYRSFSNWPDWENFYQVHGHPEYGTVVKWID